ncbi:MAG: GNAT family N-acetyltransferase [Chloroflexi bacterium]|nr:GNAT family N-acetyltransferase [Chloroflexota bacterium]
MNDKITIRPFVWDDLPALVDVINASVEANGEDQFATLDDLRTRFEQPYFFPLQNVLVAVEPGGAIVGCVSAEMDPRYGRGWGFGQVHPAWRNQGVGARLLHAADARHLERAAVEVAPEVPIEVTRFCRDSAGAAGPLLEASGYSVVRVTWFMQMALDMPVEAPPLPAGITLRPFVRERDALAVHEAQDDVFRDNWGWLSAPHEVWTHYAFDEHFDPALWLVAYDAEGHIAGLCLNKPWGNVRPELGWVDTLGVRADLRGRGLGHTLLLHGLHTLQQHGFTQAGLEVDSENQTNAVALYERAGMHVDKRYLIYGKQLRAGAG